MATIRDVARLAGVSVATVSNSVNDPGRVSEQLRARVLKAIESLNYAPRAAARSLRKQSSGLLGLIVADITNPFFTELVQAVEGIASQQGFSVLLCNSDEDPAREEKHLQVLRSQWVDGIILATTGDVSLSRSSLLSQIRVPVVLVDRAFDGLGLDAVVLDNRLAAHQATEHLIRRGHRRIGLLSGPTSVTTGADRLAGYREALLASQIRFDPGLVLEAGFREQQAYDATVALMRLPQPPTAVFAANNLMAIGMMRALSDLDLRCPDDVSVISIDDFAWANVFRPKLTTVAQPVREMGEMAVKLLTDRINGHRSGTGSTHMLESRLVIRESCAAPVQGTQPEPMPVESAPSR
ncbi:LacI family DNA-binding transcriptional regulator [Ferrovibrio terrae]|uniref:LacI family DNA-binding transcriptional regulator n=1 Tax=Ferrovibrio terrae TaxID=2594003 RepID=UPI003137AC0F